MGLQDAARRSANEGFGGNHYVASVRLSIAQTSMAMIGSKLSPWMFEVCVPQLFKPSHTLSPWYDYPDTCSGCTKCPVWLMIFSNYTVGQPCGLLSFRVRGEHPSEVVDA